ncbi:hypothetical protein HMI55_005354 [Coelomomyces lativittatus]|nr:hypothetical protein HMI55_005354 [Coelomomyces lativittatus]
MASAWHPSLLKFNQHLESHQGHLVVLILVLIDLVFVYVELILIIIACETNQPSLVKYANILGWVSVAFFVFFLIENIIRMV